MHHKYLNNPYENIYGYSNKTKSLVAQIKEFYKNSIGTYKQFDEKGKLIKEINWDTPYKFYMNDVISKIKKEYNINLEDKSQRGVLKICIPKPEK